MAKIGICAIDGCDKPRWAREWCKAHWTRFNRHGDPLGGNTSRGVVPKYLAEVVLSHEGGECLFWPYGRDGNGYAKVYLNKKNVVVHRYVCRQTHGNPPKGQPWALHSCGNGHLGCVNPRHLRWGSPRENWIDRVEHGRGSRDGWSTPRLNAKIQRLGNDLSPTEIAEVSGVPRMTVIRILDQAHQGI